MNECSLLNTECTLARSVAQDFLFCSDIKVGCYDKCCVVRNEHEPWAAQVARGLSPSFPCGFCGVWEGKSLSERWWNSWVIFFGPWSSPLFSTARRTVTWGVKLIYKAKKYGKESVVPVGLLFFSFFFLYWGRRLLGWGTSSAFQSIYAGRK